MALLVIAIAGTLLVGLICAYRCYIHWGRRATSSSNELEYEEL